MREFFDRLLRRRPRRPTSLSSPPVALHAPPATPAGWSIVPHPMPGVTAYEASGVMRIDRQREAPQGPASTEMVGLNATEFHGFPPETLEIGDVSMRAEIPSRVRLTYRLLFNPAGWRRPGSSIPSFDYHRLPLGGEDDD